MLFIQREDIKVYKTIHDEDRENFFRIASLHPDNKFQLVEDKEQIKEILLNNFASKSRGGDYTSGLPSATVISSGLFPMSLDENKSGNSIGLLNWFNNQSKEDYDKQQIENKKSLDRGNFLHCIVELALTHDVRKFNKVNNLELYIDWASQSSEMQKNIENFDEKLPELTNMARKTLAKFFENEIGKIDCVFAEIFIKNKNLQGAIDAVGYIDKTLYVIDHKSSKKSASRSQLEQKGYLRQLEIYSRMLLEDGIISKKEFDSMEFQINFFNHSSEKSKIERFSKKEVSYWQMYNEYVLNWFWEMTS